MIKPMVFGDVPILFQNTEFIAVDKPAGLSVHNNEDPQNLLKVIEAQLQISKLYPVHRLDKETSGVQILALGEKPAKTLAAEFENRRVGKTYVGLLRGPLETAEGVWNQALSDKAEGRRSPSGQAKDRVPCETRFRVIESSKYFSLCEFDLITGRQHQIRKHAAVNGHAIVGDPRYGDKKYNEKIAGIYNLTRMFLHCAKLEISAECIESPLPKDFSTIQKNLAKN